MACSLLIEEPPFNNVQAREEGEGHVDMTRIVGGPKVVEAIQREYEEYMGKEVDTHRGKTQ